MTIALISDVQLGNHKRFGGPTVGSLNTRCTMILDVLAQAINIINGAAASGVVKLAPAATYRVVPGDVRLLVVCGDLFDYVRPEAPLIAAVQHLFERAHVDVALLRGNHEMVSDLEGDNALAPLQTCALIVDEPRWHPTCPVAFAPYQRGPVRDWLPDVTAKLASECPRQYNAQKLLVLHMGIKDERTPPWLRASPAAIELTELRALCTQHGFTAVASGDWHRRKHWWGSHADPVGGQLQYEPEVLQVGALVPTGWDNPGLEGYGTLAYWDECLHNNQPAFQCMEIPGPRFVKVTNELERAEVLAAAEGMSGAKIFVSTSASPEDLTTERAFWMRQSHKLHGLEVLPDETMAKVEARAAAAAASSKETLEEALSAFVERMPLREGVDREAVLKRARAYLESGAP